MSRPLTLHSHEIFKPAIFPLLSTLVILFSLRNAMTVKLRFIVWEFSASQALDIFLSALRGALIGRDVSPPVVLRLKPAA